jgi:hypothetical protein
MATLAFVRECGVPGPSLFQYDFSMDNGLTESRFSIQEYVRGIALVKCQLITGSCLADLISSDGEYTREKS